MACMLAGFVVYGFGAFLVRRDGAAAILAAVVGLILGLIGAMAGGAMLPRTTTTVATYELVSMQTAHGDSGAFVVGTGTVRGTIAYDVYVKNRDGSVSPRQIVAANDNVSIFQRADLHGTGMWTRKVTQQDGGIWLITLSDPSYSDTLVVPEGTVLNNFSAN